MITALATGLGALPLLFKKQAEAFVSSGQVIAAALMTCASFQLLNEARQHDYLMPILGILAGMALIYFTDRLVERFPDVTQIIESDSAVGARKGFLIIFVMTIHSAAEGVGIGVSFGGGQELGALISLTIALHNIPEGLAISVITVPRGMGVLKASLWSIFTSLPQPLIAVISFIFVTLFRPFLPFGLGLAAGAMFWMVATELLPEARKDLSILRMIVVFLASCLLFVALVFVL
jgi:zinc transporter ZupT